MARFTLKRKLTHRWVAGALKIVKKLEERGRTTLLAMLCRETRAICMCVSLRIGIAPHLQRDAASAPPTEEEGGCRNCCSQRAGSALPRIKDEDCHPLRHSW